MMKNKPFLRRVPLLRGVPVRKASIPFLSALALSGQIVSILVNNPLNVLPPAISADGRLVLFGAATSPDGKALNATNLFAFTQGATQVRQLTNYTAPGPSILGVTSLTYPGSGANGAFTAVGGTAAGGEE